MSNWAMAALQLRRYIRVEYPNQLTLLFLTLQRLNSWLEWWTKTYLPSCFTLWRSKAYPKISLIVSSGTLVKQQCWPICPNAPGILWIGSWLQMMNLLRKRRQRPSNELHGFGMSLSSWARMQEIRKIIWYRTLSLTWMMLDHKRLFMIITWRFVQIRGLQGLWVLHPGRGLARANLTTAWLIWPMILGTPHPTWVRHLVRIWTLARKGCASWHPTKMRKAWAWPMADSWHQLPLHSMGGAQRNVSSGRGNNHEGSRCMGRSGLTLRAGSTIGFAQVNLGEVLSLDVL